MQLLVDNGVLSVPVFDNKAGRYTKFLDILDILTFVVTDLGKDVIKSGYETFASNPVFATQCKKVAGTFGSHRSPPPPPRLTERRRFLSKEPVRLCGR